jgi:hypothetical protein
MDKVYSVGTTVYAKGYDDPTPGKVTSHSDLQVGSHGGFLGPGSLQSSGLRTVQLHHVVFANGNELDMRASELTTRKPRV